MTKSDSFTKLTRRQRAALAALLSQPSVSAAAADGCSRMSIYRWLRDDGFRVALAEAEGQALGAAARRLIVGQDAALNTLANLIQCAEHESVKRAVASGWLAHLLRLHELAVIGERLARLEEVLYESRD